MHIKTHLVKAPFSLIWDMSTQSQCSVSIWDSLVIADYWSPTAQIWHLIIVVVQTRPPPGVPDPRWELEVEVEEAQSVLRSPLTPVRDGEKDPEYLTFSSPDYKLDITMQSSPDAQTFSSKIIQQSSSPTTASNIPLSQCRRPLEYIYPRNLYFSLPTHTGGWEIERNPTTRQNPHSWLRIIFGLLQVGEQPQSGQCGVGAGLQQGGTEAGQTTPARQLTRHGLGQWRS